jgi:hypothetical protein
MEGYEQKITTTPEIGEDIPRVERKDCVPKIRKGKTGLTRTRSGFCFVFCSIPVRG